MDSSSNDSKTKILEIPKEHELRLEVDFDATISVKLLEGTVECFGNELAHLRVYTLSGTKCALFTWHGCTIELSGNCHHYIATETPMVTYLNVQNRIEEERIRAAENNGVGPKVMIVGPTDSGKTTLSKILLNYAVRKGHQPIYVDLDIGQGSITVPGMLASVSITQPIPIGQEEFTTTLPLVYFFGHVTPSDNVKLYKMQHVNLARDINKKMQANPSAKFSGLIINTCGWVDGLGYELLLYSIDTIGADIVLVIDHERLFNDLTQQYSNKNVHVVKLTKSGGVVTRDPTYRRKSRMTRIREYFYGVGGAFYPHSIVLDFKDIVIFKVGGGAQASQTALPINSQSATDPIRLVEVMPSAELAHSILGVSHAKSPEHILNCNLAGFLYVTEVAFERQKIVCLAPCPGPLPSKYLILGSLKWLE